MVRQATTLDEESAELFSQLVKRLFTKPVEQEGESPSPRPSRRREAGSKELFIPAACV